MLKTIRQAAEFLSVSIQTVKRLVKRGQIRVVRIGRSVRIDDEDLNLFIERRKL